MLSVAASYDAALTAREGGDLAGAAARLERLAKDHPDTPEAAEALWDAARIRGERLAQPAAAIAICERLIREHPQGVPAQRARGLIRRLERLGAREQPQALESYLAGFAKTAVADHEIMAAHLARWPDGATAPLARLWLARHAAPDEAEAHLKPLLALGDASSANLSWRWLGWRVLGQVRMHHGDYGGAMDAFLEVGEEEAAGRARRMRRYGGLALAAGIGVGLCWVLFFIRAARDRRLWPPPRGAGVAAIVGVATLCAVVVIAPRALAVVASLAAGGVVLLWLDPPGVRRHGWAAYLALRLSLMGALAFAVIFQLGQLRLALDVLRFGWG